MKLTIEICSPADVEDAKKMLGMSASFGHTSFDNPRLMASDPIIREIVNLAGPDRKINAIKVVRLLTGLGLKDSKNLVESHLFGLTER